MSVRETAACVKQALANNGYTVEFDEAFFLKTNEVGQEVYKITFTNEDTGEPDYGLVYLTWENGVAKADF